MKDRILKAIFILTILFVLYISFAPYIILELWRIQSGQPTAFQLTLNDIKDDIDNTINKSKYNKLIDDYIKKRFGKTVSKNLKIINNDGYRYKVMLNDIMDKVFYVKYEKNSGICFDNFNETAFRDEKFQHLYSNWVKKQVGIDDENIDIEVSCNEIRFDEIEKYETEEDIFQYTSGSIDEIRIKTEKSNEIGAYDEKFREFEKKYVEKLYDINVECAYRFVLMGEDEEIYLDYKIDEYMNNYSNECYRTKYTWECNDELWIKVQEFLRSDESERAEKFNGIAKILKINEKNRLMLFEGIKKEIKRLSSDKEYVTEIDNQERIERYFRLNFYKYFKYIKLMMEDKYAEDIAQEFISVYINNTERGLNFEPRFPFNLYYNNIKKELYSMVASDGKYKEVKKIDFNEKSYKYIINDVLVTNKNWGEHFDHKPIHIFNLSDEIIKNYYYREYFHSFYKNNINIDVNKNYTNPYNQIMMIDDELSDKLEYKDGYIVYETVTKTKGLYRDNTYEARLTELQYKSIEGRLDGYILVSKVKGTIKNKFGDYNNGYVIYVKGMGDEWEEVYRDLSGDYIETSATHIPPPKVYEKVVSKFREYYEAVKR